MTDAQAVKIQRTREVLEGSVVCPVCQARRVFEDSECWACCERRTRSTGKDVAA